MIGRRDAPQVLASPCIQIENVQSDEGARALGVSTDTEWERERERLEERWIKCVRRYMVTYRICIWIWKSKYKLGLFRCGCFVAVVIFDDDKMSQRIELTPEVIKCLVSSVASLLLFYFICERRIFFASRSLFLRVLVFAVNYTHLFVYTCDFCAMRGLNYCYVFYHFILNW